MSEAYKARIVAIADVVPGSEELAATCLDAVEWERPVTFRGEGRTASLPLEREIRVDDTVNGWVRSLKLKGIGLGDVHGHGVPPPLGRYHHRRAHFAVSDEGGVKAVWPEDGPVGGIFLDRAMLEHENALRLGTSGCPSVLPIAVFEYEHLRCDWAPDRPIGAVLTGNPTADPHRLDLLFECDQPCLEPPAGALSELLGFMGCDRHEAVETIAYEYGRTLREFHQAGLFRHNAHPSNVVLSRDSGRVSFVDLDSSRRLADCTELRRPIELLRDVASGAYSVLDVMIRPDIVGFFPPDELPAQTVILALLQGYFADDFRSALPHDASDWRDHADQRHRAGFAERRAGRCCTAGMHPRGEVLVDLEHFYAAVMCDLVPSYERSELAGRHPLGRPAADVEAMLADEARSTLSRSTESHP